MQKLGLRYIPEKKNFKKIIDLIIDRGFRVNGKDYVILHYCNASSELLEFLLKNGVLNKLGPLKKTSEEEGWDYKKVLGWHYNSNSTLYRIRKRVRQLTVKKILGLPEELPIPFDWTLDCALNLIKEKTFKIGTVLYAVHLASIIPSYILKRMIEKKYLGKPIRVAQAIKDNGSTWEKFCEEQNAEKWPQGPFGANTYAYKILKDVSKFIWK